MARSLLAGAGPGKGARTSASGGQLAVALAPRAGQHVGTVRAQAEAARAEAHAPELVDEPGLDGVAQPGGDVAHRGVGAAGREVVEGQWPVGVQERARERLRAGGAPVAGAV